MARLSDEIDSSNAAFDPPDPDIVYRNYLETCRRLGIGCAEM